MRRFRSGWARSTGQNVACESMARPLHTVVILVCGTGAFFCVSTMFRRRIWPIAPSRSGRQYASGWVDIEHEARSRPISPDH